MTKQYGFVVDVSRCTGCRTCAVACKDAHNLPVGLNLRRVQLWQNLERKAIDQQV